MADVTSPAEQPQSIGISASFSGGGFRATFFALGAYRRLVEMGLTELITRISAVSGGSLAAAKIVMERSRGPFLDLNDFDARVTVPLRRFGQMGLRKKLMLGWRPWRLPRSGFSREFRNLLDEYLFGGAALSALSGDIELCVNATSLHTGRRFRFERSLVGDSTYGVTHDLDGITLSTAVACSAAFPMFFAPIALETEGRTFHSQRTLATNLTRASVPAKIWLTDGGVYDNLGSEPILQGTVPFVIVDASGYLENWAGAEEASYFARSWRPMEVSLDQIVLLRRRLIFQHALKVGGLMLMLRDPIEMLAVDSRHGRYGPSAPARLDGYASIGSEAERVLAALRTDLDAFNDIEVDALLWAGAARMDIGIRRYLAGWVGTALIAPPRPPSVDPGILAGALKRGQQRTWFGR